MKEDVKHASIGIHREDGIVIGILEDERDDYPPGIEAEVDEWAQKTFRAKFKKIDGMPNVGEVAYVPGKAVWRIRDKTDPSIRCQTAGGFSDDAQALYEEFEMKPNRWERSDPMFHNPANTVGLVRPMNERFEELDKITAEAIAETEVDGPLECVRLTTEDTTHLFKKSFFDRVKDVTGKKVSEARVHPDKDGNVARIPLEGGYDLVLAPRIE